MKTMRDEKKNLTDSDARFMKNGQGRIDAGYNCQTAVTREQIIVSSEVITSPTDHRALELMVKSSDQNLREQVKEIAADSGYSSYDNYEYLEKKRQDWLYTGSRFSKRDN